MSDAESYRDMESANNPTRERSGALPKGGKFIKDHLFICGITGSGKTTYAVYLFKEVRGLKIFINTQYEPKVEACGKVVNSLKELVDRVNDGETAIVFNPPETGMSEILDELRQVLFKMGKLLMSGKEDKQFKWCFVFIDEVHNFGEDLNLWVTQGRRWGITVISISQRPALVSHTILTQSEKHVIFLCGPYETPYFERYHIPLEDYEDWLKRPYHFIILTPRGIVCHPPIRI